MRQLIVVPHPGHGLSKRPPLNVHNCTIILCSLDDQCSGPSITFTAKGSRSFGVQRFKVPGFDVHKAPALGPSSRRKSFQIMQLRLYENFSEFVNWESEIENWASNIFTVGADK